MKYILLLLLFASCANANPETGAANIQRIGSSTGESGVYAFDYNISGMHYKVITRYKGGVNIINITLDSLQIINYKNTHP